MSNNKHLQNEWRRWTAKLREGAAGRLVHPNGLVATLERDADGRPNVGVWRCAIPQSGEAGEQFVYPVVLRFSAAFPQEPPDVRFEPPVWHPNVDPQTGALGLPAFLDAQQRPETSVEAILEQIQRVFEMPQPSPVLNEQAAYIRHYHFDTYEQIVRSQSHRFAAAVILKAFDLSRAALQTAFCALPTAPPPLSPGDSSDSSADRPGPSTRVRAAPDRKLKRHLETEPPKLKPAAAPSAALPVQQAAQPTADASLTKATAGATAQPPTARLASAPSAEAIVEARKEAPVKVREQVQTKPVNRPSAPPAVAPTASTVKQPPTSAPPTEVPAAQQPTAPLVVAPATQQPPPPITNSVSKPASAPVPLLETPVVEKDGKTTTSIPSAFVINGVAYKVVPSSQPAAGATDRTTHSTSKTIVAKQPITSFPTASAPPVAPAQANTAPLTREQPTASSNVAPPPSTDNSSPKPPSAPVPSTKGPREQATIFISPAGAFQFGATAKVNTQPSGGTAKQPPISCALPSSQPTETTAGPSTTEQPTNSASSAGTTTQPIEETAASSTARQAPTPALVVQPTAATIANPAPAPLDVTPFALHADAIFRELQAAGRSDLALRLRQKVVAVVYEFDKKLGGELERKEKPPVRQPKPAQQPAVGAKPQPPKRSPVVYGANHLWTDESEEEDEVEKRKERPARRPAVQREENRREQQPRDERDTNSPHVNLLGEPLPLENRPQLPTKQPDARGPPKPSVQQLMAQQLANLSALQQQLASLSALQQQQRLFPQAPPLPFLPPPLTVAQPPGYPTPFFDNFAFNPQPMRPMPPPLRMGGPAGGYSIPGMPVSQSGRPGAYFSFGPPMAPPPVPAGQQQHTPSAAPVEAPKRPPPTAQPDERKELEDEVERLLKLQQDFIVQQREEQAEWQKRLDELKATPTAPIDQPKEQTAAYEQFLMQKIRAIWTEEDRRQQAAVSTARPAQKTKETRTKKTAEQKRQRAKKPPTAQPTEQKKIAVEETVARAKAQGDLLFERLRKMRDEVQQPQKEPTAQPAGQETNQTPVLLPTDEQKQRSQEDAPTARPEQKAERTVALRKPNQDLLMHVQMPTKQRQQRAEENGSTEGTPPDLRARIQQQLERFLSHQPAVEVVACWVENPDGSTVPIAPVAPSTSAARIEEEPRQSTSKEPESPAYSIVNLLDSENETGWTDADDVEVIDSDYQ